MSTRVLFRVAAGPRIGFGHLVRSRTLAAALQMPAVVSLRGTPATARVAAGLGVRLCGSLAASLRKLRPALLVVDDPCRKAAQRAIRTARQLGIATASVHDLGLAPSGADVTIDGSIAPGSMTLAGVRFALLDPRLRALAARRRTGGPRTPMVLVAFGGGPRRRLAVAVARAIVRRQPDVDLRVACGFGWQPAFGRDSLARRIRPVEPTHGFRDTLASATVAVLAGGVTLYEACTLGVPAVGISIVHAQRKSVAGLARRGAVVDGGHAQDVARTAARAASLVARLLEAPERRRRLSGAARRVVDGRGAARVAAVLRSMIPDTHERAAA